MGKLTVTGRNNLLTQVFKSTYSQVATVYLCLCTADPTETATGAACNEVANVNNYARTAITFGAASARAVAQNALVTFPTLTGGIGTVTHFAICSSATYGGGECLAYGSFTSSFTPVSGNAPKIASGQCVITINATAGGAGFTTWGANKLLDQMFRNQAWTKPTLYLAMSSTVIDDADALTADFTEQTGTGYSRTSLAAGSFGTAAAGAITNTGLLSLPSPTAANWILVAAFAIMDASSAGNLICYDSANVVDQTPGSGDTLEIPIGNYDCALT